MCIRDRGMGMGADDRGDTAVQVIGERFFLRSRFCMEIDQHDARIPGLFEQFIGTVEGTGQAVQINDAHQIEDAHLSVQQIDVYKRQNVG